MRRACGVNLKGEGVKIMSDSFKGVEIGLNHATTDTTETDVIYLETIRKNGWDSIMAITVEEAEWLAIKLVEYANKFKE